MRLKILSLAAGALFVSAGAASAATVTNPLHLRSQPSASSRIIATMPAGSNVGVLGCGGGWCRVDWRGREGYASSRYLAGGGGGYAPPPTVYAPPPPVVTFGFGFGSNWGHHGWRNHGGRRHHGARPHRGGRHHAGAHHRGGGRHHGGGHRGGGGHHGGGSGFHGGRTVGD